MIVNNVTVPIKSPNVVTKGPVMLSGSHPLLNANNATISPIIITIIVVIIPEINITNSVFMKKGPGIPINGDSPTVPSPRITNPMILTLITASRLFLRGLLMLSVGFIVPTCSAVVNRATSTAARSPARFTKAGKTTRKMGA